MKPADILKKNTPPSILIFGPAGTRKTALVSQLSKAYLFDFDKGMRTAATFKDKFFDARQGIEFDVYRDPDPRKPTAFLGAMKKMMDIVQLCGARKWKHDACIVDSLTGLCRAVQMHNQFASSQNSFAKMEIQNWGALVNDVEKFLTLLRSLHVLTIVTAHVDFIEKKKTSKSLETEITDMFPSSATKKHGFKKLMWLFDEVLYADYRPIGANKMSYRVTGIPTGIIKARTRSGIGLVRHDETGMVDLLKQMGYDYERKEKEHG